MVVVVVVVMMMMMMMGDEVVGICLISTLISVTLVTFGIVIRKKVCNRGVRRGDLYM